MYVEPARATAPMNEPSMAPLVQIRFTVPGLTLSEGQTAGTLLQSNLNMLIDMSMALKHAHWNVVGPHFMPVHKLLDKQTDEIRGMADAVAERIAALGCVPIGTLDAVARSHSPEYPLMRAAAMDHLRALCQMYDVVILRHRHAMTALGGVDVISQNLIIGQTEALEKAQWLLRAHMETPAGELLY